jgi:hypothetical protein
MLDIALDTQPIDPALRDEWAAHYHDAALEVLLDAFVFGPDQLTFERLLRHDLSPLAACRLASGLDSAKVPALDWWAAGRMEVPSCSR